LKRQVDAAFDYNAFGETGDQLGCLEGFKCMKLSLQGGPEIHKHSSSWLYQQIEPLTLGIPCKGLSLSTTNGGQIHRRPSQLLLTKYLAEFLADCTNKQSTLSRPSTFNFDQF
jgi:hypothetical protein